MGQFSRNLLQHGYRVVVLTQIFPGREGNDFHGVEVQAAEPIQFPEMVRSYVASGRYDACVLVQDPLGVIIWSLEGLIPPPETRVLIQPIINEDGYERWRDHPNFGQRLANILRHTGRTIIMTRDGPDARFMQSVDIEPEFIPNAAKPAQIAGDFRAQLGLKPEDFLILHVANLHWVKNHAGLIDTLQDIPSNWKLVMVGNTSGEPDCVQTVCGKLALRPEILFVPGLSKEWISAAMESADVVVLASKGEGSPITILEAMAHGRPWIATPQCGAANEHLGGFICDLPAFRHRLELLFNAPHLRVQIGAVGHAHWKQCYSWDVVMPAWIELIEKGKLDREFIPDSHLVERMSQLRQQLLLSSDSLETLDSVIAEVYALDVMEIITIAQQHAERGETQRAVVIYRAWLTRDQHSLRFAVEYNLGTILENSGSLGAAREAYQCALALAPGLEVAKTALGRIRKRTEIF
jgi:glycosyltransferase involved in cell wall biosynthesis